MVITKNIILLMKYRQYRHKKNFSLDLKNHQTEKRVCHNSGDDYMYKNLTVSAPSKRELGGYQYSLPWQRFNCVSMTWERHTNGSRKCHEN